MPNISNIENIKITYDIAIKDNYIQYIDINSNKIITWLIEYEFIKENDKDNNYHLPYFKWKYNLVDNNKLPLLTFNNYDFYYKNVIFTIYKFNENKLFILEQLNNNIKKYILKKLN